MNKAFTIEDIHAIRYQIYEETKEMTNEELLKRSREKSAEFFSIMRKINKQRDDVVNQ